MGELQAVISDIHGNLEALEAVLADIKKHGVTSIVCLGDLVGYGPDPIACVRHAMNWDVVLMGEHDEAAVDDDDLSGWSSPSTKQIIFKFRRLLEEFKGQSAIEIFLRTRLDHYASPQALYVHGSPSDSTHEFVFPEDINNRVKMNSIAEMFEGLCFCGHTHIPGIFIPDEEGIWGYYEPEESDPVFRVEECKTICNVGSVGQPRDGDPRASYVLFDGKSIEFRRVAYDVKTTIRKIRNDDDYDDYLGDRLNDGR